MKKITVLAAAVLAALVLSAPAASAQTNLYQSAIATVDFPFVVDGKSMPAGSYLFQVDDSRLLVRPRSASAEPLLTSVLNGTERANRQGVPELVFDKVGGTFYLSEVHFPGQAGFTLLTTKEEHEHRVVGGSSVGR